MLRDLWHARPLLWALTVRQYQIRYRQSTVGVVWAFLTPLVTLAAATLVFGKVVEVDTGSIPYPLFALSAIVPWTFFASSVNSGVQSISQAQSLITRFAFPRMVLPLSVVGTAFLDLAISLVVFVGYLVVTGTPLPATAALFPVLLLIEVGFVLGVTSLVSATNVFARDVKLVVPFGLQLWLLVTPVMYPLSAVPEDLLPLYRLNPMTGIVESFRDILVYGTLPSLPLLIPSLVGALGLLLLGFWYFGATEKRFADVV